MTNNFELPTSNTSILILKNLKTITANSIMLIIRIKLPYLQLNKI